jgi:DnaD/phage-associated family protein
MQTAELNMEKGHVHKLLCAASGDAALLYLYLHSGNSMENAERELNMNPSRLQCAAASLRQLGLWSQQKTVAMVGERPSYSETDVVTAMDTDMDFKALHKEVQRNLGRTMTTEEVKILLGFVRYLGFSGDVILLLINHCREKVRRKGSTRNPSLRTIEKEAYAWAEQGIDTLEEAIAYIQRQDVRFSRLGRLMNILQIRGRNLTQGEEKYAQQWLEWGFDEEAISMAYERTCLNTGGLSWAYMNKILKRWQESGLLTAEQIRTGDRKPVPKGATGQLGDAELEAIRKLMQEG